MDQVRDCKRLHAKGLAIRQIARDLGIARNTVRAYLRGEREVGVFEGLILGLIAAEAKPFDFDKWRCLGLEMGVDTESVFEADFWCKFEAWGGVGA